MYSVFFSLCVTESESLNYFGSFKNSVGERKTETRKTQMSSRKGTHFKLRKRQGTKVLEISKMRVLN